MIEILSMLPLIARQLHILKQLVMVLPKRYEMINGVETLIPPTIAEREAYREKAKKHYSSLFLQFVSSTALPLQLHHQIELKV
jgi:hypothetical protein